MDDAAKLGEFAIKQGVGVEVTGGAKAAIDDFAIEVGDDHVGGGEAGVIHSAGLDHNEGLAAGTVDAAGIAEGMGSEAAARDLTIGFNDLFTE